MPSASSISLRKLGRGDYLLMSKKRANSKLQSDLARRYAVINILNHLIYDLKKPGPSAEYLELKFYPSNWWWSFKHSIFYPPHKLVNNKIMARDYLERLKVASKK